MFDVDRRCGRIAAGQHGVLSRDQAWQSGMSDHAIRRRIAAGLWIAVFPGVYRVSAVAPTWHQQLMAATLWAGPDSVVSHRSAAGLWGMDGYPQEGLELSVRRSTRSRDGSVILHRSNRLERRERARVRGIAVTRAERTLLDLGWVAPADKVEEALECCLRRRWVTEGSLREELARSGARGRRGAATLRKLLEARTRTPRFTESLLETRLLKLLRVDGLPLPQRQFEVREGSRLLARLDFAYPAQRVALEADGETHHLRRVRWEKDHLRRNALAAHGWICLVVTWSRVHGDPEGIVSELRAVLASRSSLEIQR